ncbi:MAG: hypothetical protein WAS21_21010 [Geminicoccaceae bacterium]
MTRNRRRVSARLVAAVLLFGTSSALAQGSDWPCPQRLVPKLEPGQMWSGPALDSVPGTPDPAVAALSPKLMDLHAAPEALTAEVKTFSDGLPAERREAALAELFAVTLDRLNADRATLISGIKRYARGQRALAEKVAAETRSLEALRQQPSPDPVQLDELETARTWDTRIFSDRQHSLRLVCDQPVLVEQRAFALARIIQEQLP